MIKWYDFFMDDFFENPSLSIDTGTGLFSRDVMVAYMSKLISVGIPFSMALVDIDNLKYVNDTYGHGAGDKVITAVADKIKRQIGDSGAVGRFGGDEFIILLKDTVNYDEIWKICHEILVKVSETEFPDFDLLHVTVTMGVARFPENAKNYDKLLESADKALYRGKTKGRNCFIIYLPEKHANIVLKKEKEKQLSSMYLHSIVFNNLTKTDDLAGGIKKLFDFLSSYFMLDHICIQTHEKIYFEKIHPLSKTKEFKPIDLDLIHGDINRTVEMFYMNTIKQLELAGKKSLHELLREQKISATCFVDLSVGGKSFGMLRADMTGQEDSFRIWQYGDMDILLTAAKTIALILNYTGQTVEQIAQK